MGSRLLKHIRWWLSAAASLALCVTGLSVGGRALAQSMPFADEIHVFAVEDESMPPPRCATLLVGSSSIRFWFGYREDFRPPVIKRGFGGSTIADVNRYFDKLVGQYHPRRIIFYAGENDLNAGATPAQAFAEFQAFMARKTAALGATPVYYISVKPSPSRAADLPAQTELNADIRGLAKTRADLVFVDIVPAMMPGGHFRPELYISDQLHMKRAGYLIWRKALDAAVARGGVPAAPGCR